GHEKLAIRQMSELKNLDARLSANTLYVFDIDNTLLRTKQDLGGDAWFTWQETLFKENPHSADLVAPDFIGLIMIQGWLFALSEMIAPEITTPQLFRELQNRGHAVILLTSR